MIEILTASKEHSRDAVRAGILDARPGFRVEAIELVGNEWQVRISDDDDSKPDFLKKKDDSSDKPKSDKSDKSEKSDDDDDDGDKKDKKDSPSVDKLRELVQQLQDTMSEVVQNAEDVAQEADGKQQKMEEIHDSVKEHVDGGDKPKGEDLGLGDAPLDAPLPEDAIGLEDIGPGAGPKGLPGGVPKPPRAAPVPSGKPKGRPMPGGVPTFTNVVVANHTGVSEAGQRMTLLEAATALESDPEFEEFEIVGMVVNKNGSMSAKLAQRS